MIINGKCPHCGGAIEFDATATGKERCPHCSGMIDLDIRNPPEEGGPKQKVSGEHVFYQRDAIMVTGSRFVVGSKTYPIHGISSVDWAKTPPAKAPAMVVMFVGLLVMMIPAVVFGLIIMGAGICVGIFQKRIYRVVLTTAAGESAACEGSSRESIRQIVEALNEAIITQGRR